MTRRALHTLDQITARAIRLLGDAEAVEGQDQWERDVAALRSDYREFTLALNDASPLPADAAARAVPQPGDPGYPADARSGGVDVRWIVGQALLDNPQAHRLYYTDPAMRQGIEIATGVLSIVAGVLVDEGDTAEMAAHIVHVAAHRLSDNTAPPGVDVVALGTANADLDRSGW